MDEEKNLYRVVADEYEALLTALNEKATRMRLAADELGGLQNSAPQAETDSKLPQKKINAPKSSTPSTTKANARREQFAAQRSATTTDFSNQPQQSLWQHRVESLDVSYFGVF